jgi:hypothetical protein
MFRFICICFDVVFTLLNDNVFYFVTFCSGFVKKHGIFTDFRLKKSLFFPNMKWLRTGNELTCCPGQKVKTFSHRRPIVLKIVSIKGRLRKCFILLAVHIEGLRLPLNA